MGAPEISKSYRDLDVWQKAMELAENVCALSRTLPVVLALLVGFGCEADTPQAGGEKRPAKKPREPAKVNIVSPQGADSLVRRCLRDIAADITAIKDKCPELAGRRGVTRE